MARRHYSQDAKQCSFAHYDAGAPLPTSLYEMLVHLGHLCYHSHTDKRHIFWCLEKIGTA